MPRCGLLGVCAGWSRAIRRGRWPVAQVGWQAKRKVLVGASNARKLLGLAQPIAGFINVGMTNPGETSVDILGQHDGMRQVPSSRLTLLTCANFIPDDLCEGLIELIDRDRRPSTIADANGDDYFRTSETCDLDPKEAAVKDLEDMLFELNGINRAHGEPVQGQRYAEGQEFKPHTDYFEPGGMDYNTYCKVSGNRTWTFMVYLNEVEAGGGTRFKVIDKTFKPETGRLLCWDNRRADGRVNPNTLHHGMKVRKGVKYVITKWYREKPWG